MDERYGKAESQKIQDTRWIEEAALAGDILLCKDLLCRDLAIARNALEAAWSTALTRFADDAPANFAKLFQAPALAGPDQRPQERPQSRGLVPEADQLRAGAMNSRAD
jgi:hypothetical protein